MWLYATNPYICKYLGSIENSNPIDLEAKEVDCIGQWKIDSFEVKI